MNVGELSDLLNISTRRIQQLVAEGVFPRADRGEYVLRECVRAYVGYLRESRAGEVSLTDERTRLARAKADAEELKLQREREGWISRKGAEEVWGTIVLTVRAGLLAIPDRAAAALVGKPAEEIRARLDAEIRRVLENLADSELPNG